jgi:hypothetical protein
MINLAGHKDPDPLVEEELFVAGIEVERLPEPRDYEVRTSIVGRLGQIWFHRAWYYWVATGPVPIVVAMQMYEQRPYGRRDVRVAGHCGCPPPEDPWLTYRDEAGRVIQYLRGENDLRLYAKFKDGTLDGALAKALGPLFRGENGPLATSPEELKRLYRTVTVDSYHIDSQGGLKVFVDAMRSA